MRVNEQLGSLFTDIGGARLQPGALYYNHKTSHAMVGLDLTVLLPIMREHDSDKLLCCCIPWPSVTFKESPYLEGPLQVCLPKDKRLEIGRVFTESNQKGPAYQVLLFKDAVLKRWDITWVHIHDINKDEG